MEPINIDQECMNNFFSPKKFFFKLFHLKGKLGLKIL